ncbi:MAG: sigma 54-interacting transcriptional regulator, partial [Planctomycetota bacterium]
MPWQLLVLSGNAEPARLQVDAPILIGRDPQCDLRLFDEACSRFHALIEPRPQGGLRLRDQGSRNGVWCQDQQVTDVAVQDDVVLRLGDTRVLVQDPHGEQARTALLSDQGTQLRLQPVPDGGGPGDAELARLAAALPTGEVSQRARHLVTGLLELLPRAEAAVVLRGSVLAGAVPTRLAVRLAQGAEPRVLSLGQDLVGQTVADAAVGSALALPLGDGHLVVTRGVELEPFTSADAERLSALQILAGHGFRLPAGTDDVGMVGVSELMQQLRARVRRLGAAPAPVLISGQSGSGKELIARALHACSARSDGPFVAVNCAALPESLFEAELFGHARGAFTGAEQARPGLIRAADGGSLFLDEIGEMPLALQAKLLRVIQDGMVQGVGEAQAQAVRVRFLAASNRDLHAAVAAGGFRDDLFYRLDVLRVQAPPLSQRREDIPALAQHILRQAAREHACIPPRLGPEALQV